MKEENNEIVSAAETISVDYEEILQRAVAVIENARTSVARHLAATANYALSIMYWQIGKRINTEVLDNKRAEYGKQIVASVARQLQAEFGKKGFEIRNIRRMMQFAHMFPDIQIVSPLVSKLSWSHFLIVMPLIDGFRNPSKPPKPASTTFPVMITKKWRW